MLRAWLCTHRRGLASQMPVLVGEAWSGEDTYSAAEAMNASTERFQSIRSVWLRVLAGSTCEVPAGRALCGKSKPA